MNVAEQVNALIAFLLQWCQTTVPRIILAFAGIALCVLIGAALWERRIRALPAIFGLLVALIMVLVGLDPNILRFFVKMHHLTRIRVIMGVVSFAVLVVTLESIRRSHLQERYALLWVFTGLIILLCAFFPGVLDVFRNLLGMQYATSVVGVVFLFLVLVAFHFSIAMSQFTDKQTRIAQQYALMEARLEALGRRVAELEGRKAKAEPETAGRPVAADAPAAGARTVRGALVAVPLLIVLSVVAVLLAGLLAPNAMIGDEVTHYYLVASQARALPDPVFAAEIPTGWGAIETRRYPHTTAWHYVGAAVYRVFGRTIGSLQLYHALFWAQFLFVAFLLARARGGVESRAAILYLLALASLPVCLIFSVTFYQDVPAAAQVLTAFYLLTRRRWLLSAVFMALAVAIKENMLLFFPAYFLLMGLWLHRAGGWRRAAPAVAVSLLVVAAAMGAGAWSLQKFADGHVYYPIQQLGAVWSRLAPAPQAKEVQSAEGVKREQADQKAPEKIVPNHPGDVRKAQNVLIYGGGVLWIVLLLGACGWALRKKPAAEGGRPEPQGWLWGAGLSYMAFAVVSPDTAPDARFLLPGLPFVLLPVAEWGVRLPRPKAWLTLVAALAILQSGLVLMKVYELRQVPPGLRELVAYLRAYPPPGTKVMMYPEGSYRLFPQPHNWYLGGRLGEFWGADDDTRLAMLQRGNFGAIVVKKHLVTDDERTIANGGGYPRAFVRDLESDPRFVRAFDNAYATVYLVPQPARKKR